ncbi:MAG: PhnD/SsuA/transferrin family substrate-binding protein [Bryobacteraceae bacterium]
MIGRRRGFLVEPTVEVIDDVTEIRKRVQAGWYGTIAVDVMEYFKLADLGLIQPTFSALRGEGGNAPRYLLVVREDSGISSIEGLAGKTLSIQASTNANLGEAWLDSMLREGRSVRPENFFRSREVVLKASSAILPVFFGKADAAIVDLGSFDVAREMNPQLGAKLRVLRTSPEFAEALVCFTTRTSPFQDEILEAMRTLHLDPEGKQALLVFRFSRLVPVDNVALARARDLWQKHVLISHPSQRASSEVYGRSEDQPSRRGEKP